MTIRTAAISYLLSEMERTLLNLLSEPSLQISDIIISQYKVYGESTCLEKADELLMRQVHIFASVKLEAKNELSVFFTRVRSGI